MATKPDVSGAIERAIKRLRINIEISQPFCSHRTVKVQLLDGDEVISEASDYIPDDRDDE